MVILQEVVDFITDVAQTVDTLLDNRYREVLRVHVSSDVYTLAGGVCRRSTDHLKVLATLALDLLAMESTFTIRSVGLWRGSPLRHFTVWSVDHQVGGPLGRFLIRSVHH